MVYASMSACDRTCDDDGDCQAGFACREASEDGCATTCAPQPLRGDVCTGVAAGDDAQCAAFIITCADGLVCALRNGTGTCAPSTGRVINETCNEDAECEADLVCATSAAEDGGECAPPTGRGTAVPCDDGAQCASGTCSEGACT